MAVFPIMFLALLAHAILRIITGGALAIFGIQHLRKSHAPESPRIALILLGMLELSLGGLFVVGFLTQLAALGVLALAISLLIFHKKCAAYVPERAFFVLLIAISLSLFITGAGAFAVDMPL